ncbi:MAG: hypothetical protein M3Z23_13410 [Acidobacteriota bacterium]|nr:hypothetical protein [Acidobacteriota bacterium]
MAAAVEVLGTGNRAVGAFRLAAFDGPHALVLDSAAPENTAYLGDEVFLNPGDSFAASLFALAKTPVLALPRLEIAEFGDRMSPRHIVPVHDGYAKTSI